MPSPSNPRSQKAITEAARRESINRKVETLRDLFLNPSKKMSLGEVLNRAALLLNGQDPNGPIHSTPSSSPSTPGPIRCRREVLNQREQCRRDLQAAGYGSLEKYVVDNGLTTTTPLSQTLLLDIVIDEIKKRMSAPAAPAPTPAMVSPAPTVFQQLFIFNLLQMQLALHQQLGNMNTIKVEEGNAEDEVVNEEEEAQDEDEYIDVVN